MELPDADKINYWKTSTSQPEKWIDRAAAQIEALGGHVLAHAYGQDPTTGASAYMMQFKIGEDDFKVVWPVLPVKDKKDQLTARRQTATLLYHDIKAKCLSATIKGARRAFFEYLRLPDGQTAGDMSGVDILEIPLILQGFDVPQIER